MAGMAVRQTTRALAASRTTPPAGVLVVRCHEGKPHAGLEAHPPAVGVVYDGRELGRMAQALLSHHQHERHGGLGFLPVVFSWAIRLRVPGASPALVVVGRCATCGGRPVTVVGSL